MEHETRSVKVSDLVDMPVEGIRAIVTQKWREKPRDVVWERTLKSVERRYKDNMPWLYVYWEPKDVTGRMDCGYKGWSEVDYADPGKQPVLELLDVPEFLAESPLEFRESADEWIAPISLSLDATERASKPAMQFKPPSRRRQKNVDAIDVDDDDENLSMPAMQMIS